MSFQTFVTQRLSALTAMMNAIATNAKKIDELPKQDPLVVSSKFHVSRQGISEYLELQNLIDTIAEIVKDNGIVIWTAIKFKKRMVVIYEDDLYLLADYINLPFQSTNFTTEYNQGDWIKLTGLGVKQIDVPYPNVIDDSGMTIEDYLSNINPHFQIKKNEILTVSYYEFDTGDGDITPTRSQSTYILPVGLYGLNNLNVTDAYKIGYSRVTTKSRDVKLSNEYHSFGITKTDGLPVSGGSAIFQSQETFDDTVSDIITRNIFPEFKFSWGYKKRYFKKKFIDNGNSYAGNINLLECNLIEGLPLMMNFKPQILLYRYKSKKHVYCTAQNGDGIMFIKKAKFYHFKPTDERHTIIDIADRKTVLDFGLEHFFDRRSTGEVWANGMKNSQANSLYRKKGKTEAHFYIHLRVKYTINGQEYISDPSDVLRVYYDTHSGKISYENT